VANRRRRAIALYQKNMTTREIGDTLRVNPKTVWRWLAGMDVARRRRGPRGRTDVPDELIRELIEDFGLSYAEAGEEVGMSKSGVMQRWWRIIGRPRADRAPETAATTSSEPSAPAPGLAGTGTTQVRNGQQRRFR
jgi:hypothetical protein